MHRPCTSFVLAYTIKPSKEPSWTLAAIISTLVTTLETQYGKSYPWDIGQGRQLPAGYILAKKKKKKKKNYESGRPIISFVDSPFRPMLNILARMIFQLIPVACPDHFATGDVYHLLSILRQAPEHGELQMDNEDLTGFFTSIDQQRFLGAWHMLLDFLRPRMDVSENEAFSVYPGRCNNPDDLIKGRSFRRLNVTRKIIIKDIPALLSTALDMQTFRLGHRCVRQLRGSPMGTSSPLSPALCLMVVSISAQIWSINFKTILNNHHLFIKHIRYVDNRLIVGDPFFVTFHRMKSSWANDSMETYRAGNGTGPRVSGLHARNQPVRTDLFRSHQRISSPFSILSITTEGSPQRVSITMPHRHERIRKVHFLYIVFIKVSNNEFKFIASQASIGMNSTAFLPKFLTLSPTSNYRCYSNPLQVVRIVFNLHFCMLRFIFSLRPFTLFLLFSSLTLRRLLFRQPWIRRTRRCSITWHEL